ncbi:hypothetical protein NFI96_008490 [Prochilodus magdalenae]|nr:hypothetical protein NFI96_008490 [Prochilodus magdalenae]
MESRRLEIFKKTWSLFNCRITEEGCAALVSALKSNPSHLREMNLGRNNPGESGVKLLSGLLEDPHCKLEKLNLYSCRITEEGCAALVSALKSNPSHLRELDLAWNNPGESGMKLLSDLLKDPHCKLETLQREKAFTELELYWLKKLLTRLRKDSTDDGHAMG